MSSMQLNLFPSFFFLFAFVGLSAMKMSASESEAEKLYRVSSDQYNLIFHFEHSPTLEGGAFIPRCT